MQYTLGFIGAGNMAEAIVRGAIASGVAPAERIIAADRSEERRGVFAELGVTVTEDNTRVVRECEQLLFAVKPQVLPEVARELAGGLRDDQIVISIMAGIGSQKIEAAIGCDARIVRVMPNTPMMVGRGMAGIALGGHAHEGDEDLALRLFSSGDNRAVVVDESQIDAITAISGSGPAYLFYFAEAMERAAGEMGLGEHARLLVSQTALGAATLLAEPGQCPAELRRKVTSPGGTTEAAIRRLDEDGAGNAVVRAIRDAETRARELGA